MSTDVEVSSPKLKDTLNSHWKNDKSNFGFRMLQKMGWTEDRGLGKQEDGRIDAVKVRRREDGLGLGMEKVVDDNVGSKSWSATATSFNAVLDILKTTYNSTVIDNSDTESANSNKIKKKGVKAVKSSKKESKRRNKKEAKTKEKSKKSPIISVGIRYHKHKAAKTLTGRSEEDRKAIFGAAMSS